MEDETGADKLRRIVKWADMQDESHFDELSVKQVIALFEKCMKADVDLIEDIEKCECQSEDEGCMCIHPEYRDIHCSRNKGHKGKHFACGKTHKMYEWNKTR